MIKIKEGKRLAGYIRVSTEEQKKALEIQIKNIKDWAERSGYNITEIYQDVISGKAQSLPNRDRLMEDARNSRFDKLAIYNIDRFGRSLRETPSLLLELLEDYGITCVITSKSINLVDMGMAKIFIMALTLVADLEHDFILMRTTAGKEFAFEQKRLFLGKDPFGYYRKKISKGERVKGDKVEFQVNEEEKEACQMMANLLLTTSKSTRDISVALAEEGIYARNGKPFHPATIAGILKKPIYYIGKVTTGEYEYKMNEKGKCRRKKDEKGNLIKKTPTTYDVPPFWDEKTGRKLKTRLESNKSNFNRPTDNNPAIGRGHTYCMECGLSMPTTSGRPRNDGTKLFYYSCKGRRPDKIEKYKGIEPCDMPPIRIEKIDEMIMNEIVNWICFPKSYVDKFYLHIDQEAKKKMEKEIKIKDKAIAKMEKEVDDCYNLIGNPNWDEERLNQKISKAENKKQSLLDERESLDARLVKIPSMDKVVELDNLMSIGKKRAQMAKFIEEMSITEKREIMDMFFPKEKDDQGLPYGIYIRRLTVGDVCDPDASISKEERRQAIPDEFTIEIRGVLNAGLLVERLREKKQYSDTSYNTAYSHSDH